MSSNHDAQVPDPLPIRVRPVAGESVESYIRRLARANHLRPSLLQVYLRDSSTPSGAIQLNRLATASTSTHAAITHALTGLSKPRRPKLPDRQQPSETTPATRKTCLFTAIRAEHSRGLSIRQISEDHHVHRRTVRQALDSPTPTPRKRASRPTPAIDPIRDAIDSLLGQNLTVWEVWTRMVDEHDADASYTTVRDYLRNRVTDEIHRDNKPQTRERAGLNETNCP